MYSVSVHVYVCVMGKISTVATSRKILVVCIVRLFTSEDFHSDSHDRGAIGFINSDSPGPLGWSPDRHHRIPPDPACSPRQSGRGAVPSPRLISATRWGE